MNIEELKLKLNESIKIINEIDEFVRKNKLENEQWFLDWQDELNQISVK